jgi:hypothetical protein
VNEVAVEVERALLGMSSPRSWLHTQLDRSKALWIGELMIVQMGIMRRWRDCLGREGS